MTVGLDMVALLSSARDPTGCVTVRGSPKNLENPTGSTTACAPVATADIANITLTVLKTLRRRAWIHG
ncbi:hypothetical protein WJX79_009729 [Trebouxia sp. C0005]